MNTSPPQPLTLSGPIIGLIFRYRLYVGLLFAVVGLIVVHPHTLWGQYSQLGSLLSLGLIILGLALRVWAAGSAGGHTHSGEIEAAALATGGPYAYVRNPIYLGSIILGLGMVGLIGDLRLLPLCVAAFALLYVIIIPAEEHFLRETFGARFDEFCAAIPRLIPRLTPHPHAHSRPFRWASAVGEWRIVMALAAIYLVFEFLDRS